MRRFAFAWHGLSYHAIVYHLSHIIVVAARTVNVHRMRARSRVSVCVYKWPIDISAVSRIISKVPLIILQVRQAHTKQIKMPFRCDKVVNVIE